MQPESVAEWREWLAAHHTRPTGVWLVTWRAGSGGPKISYAESVEQALCFGWVDSLGRTLDDERTMLWFAPRKARSGWARTNKQRIERLTAAGLMAPAGLAVVEAAKADGSWTLLDAVEDLLVPDDLAAALQPPSHRPASTGRRSRVRSNGRSSSGSCRPGAPRPGPGGWPRRRRRRAATSGPSGRAASRGAGRRAPCGSRRTEPDTGPQAGPDQDEQLRDRRDRQAERGRRPVEVTVGQRGQVVAHEVHERCGGPFGGDQRSGPGEQQIRDRPLGDARRPGRAQRPDCLGHCGRRKTVRGGDLLGRRREQAALGEMADHDGQGGPAVGADLAPGEHLQLGEGIDGRFRGQPRPGSRALRARPGSTMPAASGTRRSRLPP